MNSKIKKVALATGLILGLMALSAQAALGIQEIFNSQGIRAVGLAVKNAVADIYSSTDDAALKEEKIVSILNEAAETGDENIIRYTIVAVMLGGGAENEDAMRAAINNSKVFSDFSEITAFTVSAAGSMISGSAGGSGNESGGGETAGGDQVGTAVNDLSGGEDQDQQGGGASSQLFGGGDPNPFDPDADDSDIDDDDTQPTPI